MDDDRRAVRLYASGNVVAAMNRYEQVMGEGFILRVQPAINPASGQYIA